MAVEVAVVIMVILALFFILRRRGDVVVVEPKLGLVDLSGGKFAALLEEDRKALSSLFSDVSSSNRPPIPRCDVLFLYSDLAPDGSLLHGPSVRQVATRAGAAIVVLASDKSPEERLTAAAAGTGQKKASLVLTYDRKGESFARFFRELFSLMKSGKGMPAAWVALAPQHPSAMNPDLPETIFLPEAGTVQFKHQR